jgi:hypothetical protein
MPTLSRKQAFAEINRRRRVRRMRRVVIGSADAAREVAQAGGRRVDGIFVTLTYRADERYNSRDVANYITLTRRYLARRRLGFSYQWVLELTANGKPHYHILWWVPKGIKLPKPDESGAWDRGSSRIERARKPVGYLVKYATKGDDGGAFPKHAKLFGVGSSDKPVTFARHRFGLPTWLYERTEGRCSRRAGLGWVCKSTGEIHATPFAVTVEKDEWGFVCVIITAKEASA